MVVAAGPVGMVVTAAREAVEKVGQKVEMEVGAVGPVGPVGMAGTVVLAGMVEAEAGRVETAVETAVVVKAVAVMVDLEVMGAVRVDLEVMGVALMVELASCTQSPPQE